MTLRSVNVSNLSSFIFPYYIARVVKLSNNMSYTVPLQDVVGCILQTFPKFDAVSLFLRSLNHFWLLDWFRVSNSICTLAVMARVIV